MAGNSVNKYWLDRYVCNMSYCFPIFGSVRWILMLLYQFIIFLPSSGMVS